MGRGREEVTAADECRAMGDWSTDKPAAELDPSHLHSTQLVLHSPFPAPWSLTPTGSPLMSRQSECSGVSKANTDTAQALGAWGSWTGHPPGQRTGPVHQLPAPSPHTIPPSSRRGSQPVAPACLVPGPPHPAHNLSLLLAGEAIVFDHSPWRPAGERTPLLTPRSSHS